MLPMLECVSQSSVALPCTFRAKVWTIQVEMLPWHPWFEHCMPGCHHCQHHECADCGLACHWSCLILFIMMFAVNLFESTSTAPVRTLQVLQITINTHNPDQDWHQPRVIIMAMHAWRAGAATMHSCLPLLLQQQWKWSHCQNIGYQSTLSSTRIDNCLGSVTKLKLNFGMMQSVVCNAIMAKCQLWSQTESQ